jgi:hypothetical protein
MKKSTVEEVVNKLTKDIENEDVDNLRIYLIDLLKPLNLNFYFCKIKDSFPHKNICGACLKDNIILNIRPLNNDILPVFLHEVGHAVAYVKDGYPDSDIVFDYDNFEDVWKEYEKNEIYAFEYSIKVMKDICKKFPKLKYVFNRELNNFENILNNGGILQAKRFIESEYEKYKKSDFIKYSDMAMS